MLSSLLGRVRSARKPPQPAIGEPLRLVGGTTVLAVNETKRRDLEIKLGPGVSYPAPGWHTWTVTGDDKATWLLSTFFRQSVLIAVEYYIGKTGNEPKYAPRARNRFLLQPADVGLAQSTRSLPPYFGAANGRAGSVGAVVYQQAFEVRWYAGVALISGNDARIERIALYGGA
jgi:hypothetical protein